MHIVIVNIKTGNVEAAKVFDTNKSSIELETFINTLEKYYSDKPEGYILAAACKDECSRNLSNKVKNWF